MIQHNYMFVNSNGSSEEFEFNMVRRKNTKEIRDVIRQMSAINISNDSDDSDDSADENYCETTTNKKAESFVTTIVRDRQLKSHLIPASTAAKKDYRSINDTISIAICNLLKSKKHENCWQVFNIFYRRVMIYGKLQVLHQYEKSEKTYYKLEIDDGTEKILGFFKVNNDEGKKANDAKRKLGILINGFKMKGIRLNNETINTKSKEFNEAFQNAEKISQIIKNLISQKLIKLQLGVVKEKAILIGIPYFYENESIMHLNVISLQLNDEIELPWKRQLNLLYERQYLK